MIRKSHGVARMKMLKTMMNDSAESAQLVIHALVIDGETGGCSRFVQMCYRRRSVRRSTSLWVAKMHDVSFPPSHRCCSRLSNPTGCDRGCEDCPYDCPPSRRLRTLCCRSSHGAKTKDFRCVCAKGSNRWVRAPRNPKIPERWHLMMEGSLENVRSRAIRKWNSDVAHALERSKVSVDCCDVRSRLVQVEPFPAFQDQTW
jgi:hypothetical protein